MTLKEKSIENWSVGKRMYDKGKYDIAANRLYYALFQAAKCCAMDRGMTEDGDEIGHYEVQRDIAQFVKIENSGRLYGKMKQFRTVADYRPYSVDATRFTQSFVGELEKMHAELVTALGGC